MRSWVESRRKDDCRLVDNLLTFLVVVVVVVDRPGVQQGTVSVCRRNMTLPSSFSRELSR